MSPSVKKAPMFSGSASAQWASRAASPPAAARFSAAMPGDQPANQSSPSASNGAGPDTLTAAMTRSGNSAAQASACGPPPEWPTTAKRPMPSASDREQRFRR
jgi:hypothetical protein